MSSEFEIELSVSDFVAVTNQTLEYAYPSVAIIGELANYRVSKNRWVYFDLKDEFATVRFFGTVYQLKTQLEDGMLLRVRGAPRLHPQFGFSVTVQQIELVGEGSIKRAASLLQAKLTAEGLFDEARKRPLPYPPRRIGLVASKESAAYIDFMKIIKARWTGLEIVHADVQVQGVDAPEQITAALAGLNQLQEPLDVIVVTRGGGSADDLQAFDTEMVVRAVANSRTPTLVAIGHERDSSLAEMAADVRASTPSNAAELLTPDKQEVLAGLLRQKTTLLHATLAVYDAQCQNVRHMRAQLLQGVSHSLDVASERLNAQKAILTAYNPSAALARGYALLRRDGALVRGVDGLGVGEALDVEIVDAHITTTIQAIEKKG